MPQVHAHRTCTPPRRITRDGSRNENIIAPLSVCVNVHLCASRLLNRPSPATQTGTDPSDVVSPHCPSTTFWWRSYRTSFVNVVGVLGVTHSILALVSISRESSWSIGTTSYTVHRSTTLTRNRAIQVPLCSPWHGDPRLRQLARLLPYRLGHRSNRIARGDRIRRRPPVRVAQASFECSA